MWGQLGSLFMIRGVGKTWGTRYGYAKTRAEKEIDLFFGELQDRLRMAA